MIKKLFTFYLIFFGLISNVIAGDYYKNLRGNLENIECDKNGDADWYCNLNTYNKVIRGVAVCSGDDIFPPSGDNGMSTPDRKYCWCGVYYPVYTDFLRVDYTNAGLGTSISESEYNCKLYCSKACAKGRKINALDYEGNYRKGNMLENLLFNDDWTVLPIIKP